MADQIDTLLERYLTVLDEYTQLRKELSTLHSQVYHSIARANFTGERGMRYGLDQYDERMCALRRVQIEGDETSYKFAVKQVAGDMKESDGGESDVEKIPDANKSQEEQPDDTSSTKDDGKDGNDGEEKKQTMKKSNDPLRWFGILTPMALRDAQRQSIEAVERVIPRLVSVNAEMQTLEIEVRRQRKRRAKAEAVKKSERDGRKEVEI